MKVVYQITPNGEYCVFSPKDHYTSEQITQIIGRRNWYGTVCATTEATAIDEAIDAGYEYVEEEIGKINLPTVKSTSLQKLNEETLTALSPDFFKQQLGLVIRQRDSGENESL